MKLKRLLLPFLLLCCMSAQGKEYHVSVKGSDRNDGSEKSPFRTIQMAADAAYPGDVITVHAGTYRERIDPPRGGTSEAKRIVYRAAHNERVEIKGSEVIKDWQKVSGSVWKVTLPNTFFGNYNPYSDPIYGDWFDSHGRIHHTGEVFLNGKSFYEKETLEKVINPEEHKASQDKEGSLYTWYCESDKENTTIWANFHKYDPNKELVEISVRNTCFYPSNPGCDYITISGFRFSQAATQWAAPTAEQVGMIATHWNKGWIIENNVISDSKCSGITLGKEKGTGHNSWLAEPDIDGSVAYIEVTFRGIDNGWNKENIGGHIVRNNTIYNCEQTGMCGSLGPAFSLIENNNIYDIWTKRQFNGAEIAGIKFHGAVDTEIRGNRICNTHRGVWLDWMSQGTRVSRNLMYRNTDQDVFLEVNHGPAIVDNNILGSNCYYLDVSQGSAFVHNLVLGKIAYYPEMNRYTPYFAVHSTQVTGLSPIPGGDDRYMNNIFASNGNLKKEEYSPIFQKPRYMSYAEGNVYYGFAKPYEHDKNYLEMSGFDPEVRIVEEKDGVYLEYDLKDVHKLSCEIIDTEKLGRAKITKQAFDNPDGTPIVFDTDYFGMKRAANPTPGAMESVKEGRNRVKIW